MGRLLHILPMAALLLLALVFAGLLLTPRDPGEVPSPLIDEAAPAFRLPDLMGGPDVTEADLKGRVTVFNVFASWCLPCRAEHPVLARIAREGRARVVGLNYKDRPEDAKAWLEELGNPYARIAVDKTGRTAIEYGVYGVPETFILDAEGRIRYKHVGPIQGNDYADKIAPVLERLAP